MTTGHTSNARIYDKLDEIGQDVAVVKSQLPPLGSRLDDHEKRLRSLEARVWYAFGAVAVVALVAPLVVQWFAP